MIQSGETVEKSRKQKILFLHAFYARQNKTRNEMLLSNKFFAKVKCFYLLLIREGSKLFGIISSSFVLPTYSLVPKGN